MSSFTLLIPAYKPSAELLSLVEDLAERQTDVSRIVVIDDGGGPPYAPIFETLKNKNKVDVVTHFVNLGKGRSIKNGLNYILNHYPDTQIVVTADADGQHLLSDILAVGKTAAAETNLDLVLGSRVFGADVPLRSKIGNILTGKIFQFLVGLRIGDTQTGLRALNRRILPQLIGIGGERYEYETNMLLEARSLNWQIKDVPIETVYIEGNRSSHFNPLTDSMKIYFLIFRFMGSSLFSSSLDFTFFAAFTHFGTPLLTAMLLARFLSGWVNFYLNRKMVFKNHSNLMVALIRYWSLVLLMGFLSSTIVASIRTLIPSVLIAKLLAESVLFIASFSIQKEFVFSKTRSKD